MKECSAFRNIGQNNTYSFPWPFDQSCFFSFAFKNFHKVVTNKDTMPCWPFVCWLVLTFCLYYCACVVMKYVIRERPLPKRRDFLIEARETRSNDTWQRAKMFQPYLKGPLCQSTLNKSGRLSWKSDFCSIGKTKYATERVYNLSLVHVHHLFFFLTYRDLVLFVCSSFLLVVISRRHCVESLPRNKSHISD